MCRCRARRGRYLRIIKIRIMDKDEVIKGGEFLIKETKAENVFIPEEFDEEQKMIGDMCLDFVDKEILPNIDRIETL